MIQKNNIKLTCIYPYSNLSIGGLAFGNKLDAPVYVSQEGGVVGLNFHQSKEVLITDSINGSAFTVSLCKQKKLNGKFSYICLYNILLAQRSCTTNRSRTDRRWLWRSYGWNEIAQLLERGKFWNNYGGGQINFRRFYKFVNWFFFVISSCFNF